jgi:hypothetical protein
MKWKIRKGKFPPNLPDDEKFMFEEIYLKESDGDPDLPKELYDNGFVEWVTYPGPENGFAPLPKISTPSQRKYELFCGGFLYYHDVEVKQKKEGKKFEHQIFFEWFQAGKNKENKVRIYINITPPEFNPNPPPPPPPPPPESNS